MTIFLLWIDKIDLIGGGFGGSGESGDGVGAELSKESIGLTFVSSSVTTFFLLLAEKSFCLFFSQVHKNWVKGRKVMRTWQGRPQVSVSQKLYFEKKVFQLKFALLLENISFLLRFSS